VITVDLRLPGDLHDALLADVAGRTEWAGYVLCGVLRGDREILLGREWCPVPAAMQLVGTGHGFSWHPDFDVQMLNRMQREGLAGVVVHYHGGSKPRLSGDDRATSASLMPFLSAEARARPHAFAVLGDRAISGSVYRDGAEIGTLGAVRVVGTWLDNWPTSRTAEPPADERYDRLIRGFGAQAFGRLRQARIGVVGGGGGAAHVLQQLAYLGVGAIILVDADRVDLTSLNRLIGALPHRRHRTLFDRLLGRGKGDVGNLKVDVMTRMVKAIDPGIEIAPYPEFFPTEATVEALRRCDLIVACVDRLQVRDDLNRFSKRFLIPMIDVGIEITPDRSKPGAVEAISGRVTKVLPAGPCLRCQGIIDDDKLVAERGGQPLGYTGAAGIPDPAVVTLNGIVASAAATEVLQQLTGFAGVSAPNCGWIYDGLTGTIERAAKIYRGCDACKYERGLGDP
jgi:molybdopterin/thiamine biosynthesis adenylyltransferase/proteasome lid subunit RPN8/RPN11